MNFYRILLVASLSVGRITEAYDLPRMPFYFPLLPSRVLHRASRPTGTVLYGDPLVAYRNPMTGIPVVHSDVCPHMGAHLHRGWIGENGGLHCPYHGFEFNQDGMFCNIPNPVKEYKRHESRICLPTFPVVEKHGYVFVPGVWPSVDIYHPWHDTGLLWPKTLLPKGVDPKRTPPLDVPFVPYFPPEQDDPHYRVIHGQREIDQHQDVVTENLLDMLHISYVHRFGNRLTPIPYEVKGEHIHAWGFRTRFLYSPNPNTISTQVGKVDRVIVENEIYLPSTTITRVIAGGLIKTVHTMTTPREDGRCTLFWRIYRNFWQDPIFPIFDVWGDMLLRYLMEKTIDEDQDILSKIHVNRRLGPLQTRYDLTIRRYREMVDRFRLVELN